MNVKILNYQIPQNNIAGPCQEKPATIRCASCIMDTSYYFTDLSVEAKRDLQPSLSLGRFNKKETLYKEGDTCRHLYILLSGEVKVYKTLPNGKQQIHKLVQIPVILLLVRIYTWKPMAARRKHLTMSLSAT
jgi:hypothetical protein